MQFTSTIILLLFSNLLWSQDLPQFYYSHSKEQSFYLKARKATVFLQVELNQNKIKYNSLFKIDPKNNQFVIPENGFYEISGSFNFNLNTENVINNRAGINFGFIQKKNNKETFVASTRFSYKNETQDGFQKIEIYPTVVYLEKNVILAPAISAGLLDSTIVNAYLGCEKKNKECTSFEWKIIKLSNESVK